jgi:hypothetical protein
MYRINDEKMFFDMEDGQAIIINSLTGYYYGMTPLGSAIVDFILKGVGRKSLLARLKALAGCPQDIEQKLDAFLKELTDKEILIADDKDEECPEFEENALSEGFDLSVEEFSEVQDLILADPVTEVELADDWVPLKTQE